MSTNTLLSSHFFTRYSVQLRNKKHSILFLIPFLLLTLLFLQSCDGGSDSSSTSTTSQGPQPNDFTFKAIIAANFDSEVLSDVILITGLSSAARISIIGGYFSIDGADFTNNNSMISNNQDVQVKLTSLGSVSSQSVATLTIGGVSADFVVTTRSKADDTNPLAFTFNAVSNASLNTDYFSNLVTIQDIDAAATISVSSGASYAITDLEQSEAAFTSVAGKILLGEQVRIKLTSANSNGVQSQAKLTVGNQSADFVVTTIIPNDSTPNAFPILAKVDVPLNTSIDSVAIIVSGINVAAAISVSAGGKYSINNGNFTANTGTVVDGDLVTVQQVSSAIVSTLTKVSLTIGGVTEDFTITTIAGTVGITATPTSLVLSESNSNPSQDITVRLNTQPNGVVVFDIVSSNPSAATVTPARITLTANNWIAGVPVTVTSVQDDIARGTGNPPIQQSDILITVVTTAGTTTDNSGYLLQTVNPVTVKVSDDDRTGVTVTPMNLGNIDEGLITKSFTVKLNSEPLNNVNFDITVTEAGALSTQASVDKTVLSFTQTTANTASNWNTPQTVTVTAVDDGVADADVLVGINVNIISADDGTGYTAVLNKTVAANIINIQVADGGAFLQYLNQSAPRNNELTGIKVLAGGVDAGIAYYQAIDPNSNRLTLTDFKAFNNMPATIAYAVYVNDADLGFGRRMYVQVSKDPVTGRTRSVASCVENYAPFIVDPNDATKQIPNVAALAQSKIDLANAGVRTRAGGFIATVCMEYSGSPGTAATVDGLKGRKFVKFFSYGETLVGNPTGPLDARITEADLDGHGNKTQPGMCTVCHGGQGNSLNADGSYPLLGDTGAQFLPWDVDTFVFDGDTKVVPAALESLFNRFNQAVLDTYPKAQSFKASVGLPFLLPATATTIGEGSVSVAVSGVSEAITSVMVSIDSDPLDATAPGIIGSKTINGVRIELISPVYPNNIIGFRKRLGIRVPGTNTAQKDIITGAINMFWADDSPSGKDSAFPIPVQNTIISGSVLAEAYDSNRTRVSIGMVRRGDCVTTIPLALDLGCRPADGTWTLDLTNFNLSSTVTLKAWSIHFNGIPEKAYLPAPVELIRGWYGGLAANGELDPLATFNPNFVPAGWITADPTVQELYLKVIGPTCRACHVQRGTMQSNDIDFSSYQKFLSYKTQIKKLVFDKGLMPLAKRTYQKHFWNSGSVLPSLLAKHIPGAVALKPGRNIAHAGDARIGEFAVRVPLNVTIGDPINTVVLNGRASIFNNNNFSWTVTAPDNSIVALSRARTANPSFNITQVGIYNVKLDTSGGNPVTVDNVATTQIEGSNTAVASISFFDEIQNTIDGGRQSPIQTCSGSQCHEYINYIGIDGLDQNLVERRNRVHFTSISRVSGASTYDYTAAQKLQAYRMLRDRVNTFMPEDSLMITKAFGTIAHAGTGTAGLFSTGPRWSSTSSGYIAFKRWILEGANFK